MKVAQWAPKRTQNTFPLFANIGTINLTYALAGNTSTEYSFQGEQFFKENIFRCMFLELI